MNFLTLRTNPETARLVRHMMLLLITGGLAVVVLSWARFPAALLLGPVIAATWLGLRGTRLRVPDAPYEVAQGVAGCMIAHYLTPDIVAQVLVLWPYVLLFAVVTLLLACGVGYLLGRLTQVDGEEAIWGFLPGMAGAVIAMSHERGLDSRVVAFIQIIRLMAVILVMSLASRLLIEGTVVPQGSGAGSALHPGVLLTLALAALGPLAARFLPVPAAATLVPLMLAALLQGTGWVDLALPGWLLVVAYFVLGIQVGLRFSPDIMRTAMKVFWPVVLFSLLLMGLCAVSGMILARIAGLDLLSGMLATVPGSIETIAIIAVNSNADLSFIMTMQVVRLFAVVLLGPVIAHRLTRGMQAGRALRGPQARPGE